MEKFKEITSKAGTLGCRGRFALLGLCGVILCNIALPGAQSVRTTTYAYSDGSVSVTDSGPITNPIKHLSSRLAGAGYLNGLGIDTASSDVKVLRAPQSCVSSSLPVLSPQCWYDKYQQRQDLLRNAIEQEQNRQIDAGNRVRD